jgi:hypothetical protein
MRRSWPKDKFLPSSTTFRRAEASPVAYKELGSAHVIEGRAFTAPVFANGKVYVRDTKGDVVCLDFRSN